MTKVKLCGLRCHDDIVAANAVNPEYVGFVFAPQSSRHVTFRTVAELRRHLNHSICPVGVFVDEFPHTVASLLNDGIISMAQLHGTEDDNYLRHLRTLTKAPIMQAFAITCQHDVHQAQHSTADHILVDSGHAGSGQSRGGTGTAFDWSLLHDLNRPYFLAGGLTPETVAVALEQLHPYGVDISSGIEVNGAKDPAAMCQFVAAVRSATVSSTALSSISPASPPPPTLPLSSLSSPSPTTMTSREEPTL